MNFEASQALNIPMNAILPFDPRRWNLALGSVEYVAWEVIVAKIFRQLLGFPKKPFFELIQVHAASMAFLGGAGAMAGAPGDFSESLLENLKDGAKGIPAVFLGKYTVDTCKRGFHVPGRSWSMSDVIASAASKAVSRPLYAALYPYIKPAGVTQPLDTVNEMVKMQTNKSNLKSGG